MAASLILIHACFLLSTVLLSNCEDASDANVIRMDKGQSVLRSVEVYEPTTSPDSSKNKEELVQLHTDLDTGALMQLSHLGQESTGQVTWIGRLMGGGLATIMSKGTKSEFEGRLHKKLRAIEVEGAFEVQTQAFLHNNTNQWNERRLAQQPFDAIFFLAVVVMLLSLLCFICGICRRGNGVLMLMPENQTKDLERSIQKTLESKPVNTASSSSSDQPTSSTKTSIFGSFAMSSTSSTKAPSTSSTTGPSTSSAKASIFGSLAGLSISSTKA